MIAAFAAARLANGPRTSGEAKVVRLLGIDDDPRPGLWLDREPVVAGLPTAATESLEGRVIDWLRHPRTIPRWPSRAIDHRQAGTHQ